jgi:hypothetical protein
MHWQYRYQLARCPRAVDLPVADQLTLFQLLRLFVKKIETVPLNNNSNVFSLDDELFLHGFSTNSTFNGQRTPNDDQHHRPSSSAKLVAKMTSERTGTTN